MRLACRARAPALVLAAAATAWLTACMEPAFEFRGYTELSSCRQVIDAELAQGASFEDAYDSFLRTEPELVTELAGQVFGQSVVIEIACNTRGSLKRIYYVADTRDPAETGAAYIRFAGELEALFGAPAETHSEGSRSLSYVCGQSSPVVLEEHELSESEHELYVGVVPALVSCLAAEAK